MAPPPAGSSHRRMPIGLGRDINPYDIGRIYPRIGEDSRRPIEHLLPLSRAGFGGSADMDEGLQRFQPPPTCMNEPLM